MSNNINPQKVGEEELGNFNSNAHKKECFLAISGDVLAWGQGHTQLTPIG